jgi:hypothetical protein
MNNELTNIKGWENIFIVRDSGILLQAESIAG